MDLEQLQDDVFDKLNMLDITQLGSVVSSLIKLFLQIRKGRNRVLGVCYSRI